MGGKFGHTGLVLRRARRSNAARNTSDEGLVGADAIHINGLASFGDRTGGAVSLGSGQLHRTSNTQADKLS